jgi:hypothetical protein
MQKANDWICIYKTTRMFEAEVVNGNLHHVGIGSVILNKQDAYMNGYVEVHVPLESEQEAMRILNPPSAPNDL